MQGENEIDKQSFDTTKYSTVTIKSLNKDRNADEDYDEEDDEQIKTKVVDKDAKTELIDIQELKKRKAPKRKKQKLADDSKSKPVKKLCTGTRKSKSKCSKAKKENIGSKEPNPARQTKETRNLECIEEVKKKPDKSRQSLKRKERANDKDILDSSDDIDFDSDSERPTTWIHIKLENHPDKYTIEKVESFERRNRGSDVFECMYSCQICKQFKSVGKEVFEEHIEFHVNKVYECKKCGYVGFSQSDMYKHKGSCCKEKKGRMYVCHLCGAELISRADKVDHMGTKHNIPELPCRWCKQLFTTRNLRKKHYRADHIELCQYCDSCKTGLSKLSKTEYRKHIETCVPGHQCQYCGKLFTRKQGLDSHVMYTHQKVRKYACKTCPYTATTPEKLKLHVQAHEGR